MALLTTGDWYVVTWLQTNDGAWSAISAPGIPSAMANDFVNATPMMIYVTDAATGSFVFHGGVADGFDDTLIDTQAGPLTKNTWTTDDATPYEYAIDSAGLVWFYDSVAGTIRRFTAPESTAMKAFLP